MSDSDNMSETGCLDGNNLCFRTLSPNYGGVPYLKIVEQPQSRGFRFRYECEGKSHGGLQGENSRRERKSFPAVQICNYQGPAKITVSLVTDEKEPRPHAHELIGKNCSNGICTVSVNGDNMIITFPNLGIRHVTKKSVTKILTDRLRETLRADKMMDGELGQDADHIELTQSENDDIKRLAQEQAKNMPLSVVRLSFRAYLQDSNGMCIRVLPAVISQPIYDSKAPCAALLRICRMDKVGGCCIGNEEVFLLCDKVQKDDITVRFYEQDDEGNVKWEDYGNFAAHDVHRQYAIVFRTPAYVNTSIDRPITVHVQLKRFSDGEVSDPKTFTYYPQQTDLEDIQKKRKKQIPNFSDNNDGLVAASKNGLYLNEGVLVQSALSRFTDISIYNNHGANGHRNGMPTVLATTMPSASCLEEDSAVYARYGCDLVSRGLLEANSDEQMLPCKTKLEDGKTMPDTSQPSSDDLSTDRSSAYTQTVNEELQWVGLMQKLALCTAKSVQLNAPTDDTVHAFPETHQNESDDNPNHCHSAALNLLSVVSSLPNNVNDQNVLQISLQVAVLTRQPDLVKVLLLYGAVPYSVFDNRTGDTLLHTCARIGNDACLNHLLHHWPCCTDNSHGKWQPGISELNYEGYTALHLAVRYGHFACVKLLMTVGGADVNAIDGHHFCTALHHAVLTDNLALIGYLLLECNPDVDKPDCNGNTALHYAAAFGKLGAAALLIAAGADADTENIYLEPDSDDIHCCESSTFSRIRMTPRDLADGNNEMLRILSGEAYCAVRKTFISAEPSFDSESIERTALPHKSIHHSGVEPAKMTQKHSAVSDLSRLDEVTRLKLSKLLDAGHFGFNWQTLAVKLGFGDLIKEVEFHKSPTRALLDNFEITDGTIAVLRKTLQEMKRQDAVRLIDEALLSHSAMLPALS